MTCGSLSSPRFQTPMLRREQACARHPEAGSHAGHSKGPHLEECLLGTDYITRALSTSVEGSWRDWCGLTGRGVCWQTWGLPSAHGEGAGDSPKMPGGAWGGSKAQRIGS